jgi:hypothetical protein
MTGRSIAKPSIRVHFFLAFSLLIPDGYDRLNTRQSLFVFQQKPVAGDVFSSSFSGLPREPAPLSRLSRKSRLGCLFVFFVIQPVFPANAPGASASRIPLFS